VKVLLEYVEQSLVPMCGVLFANLCTICNLMYWHFMNHKALRLILQAISLMNMIAIHPICACSMLVLQVQGELRELVVLVLGVEVLAFLLSGDTQSACSKHSLGWSHVKLSGDDNVNCLFLSTFCRPGRFKYPPCEMFYSDCRSRDMPP
jgi:hypothetical protein